MKIFHCPDQSRCAFIYCSHACESRWLICHLPRAFGRYQLRGGVLNLAGRPTGSPQNFVRPQARRISFEHRAQDRLGASVFEYLQEWNDRLILAFAPRRLNVEYDPAPNRFDWRKLAHDEAIARQHQNAFLEPQLSECRIARGYVRYSSNQNNFCD